MVGNANRPPSLTPIGGGGTPRGGLRTGPIDGGSDSPGRTLPGALGHPTANAGTDLPGERPGSYPHLGGKAPPVPMTTMSGLRDPLLDDGDPLRSPGNGATLPLGASPPRNASEQSRPRNEKEVVQEVRSAEEEEHPTKRTRRGFRAEASAESSPSELNSQGSGNGEVLPGGMKLPGTAARPVERPGWINANRDWFISIECTADAATILATKQRFPIEQLTAGASSPLVQAVARMIEKKQATVRPGQPPYRPIVKLLVWPNAMRTYYRAYPALETLGVPMRRENLDPDYADPPALWE
jgi:hypothetical protein